MHQRLLGRSFDPARWDYDRYFEVERARTVPGPVAPGEITADLLDSIIASYPKGTHSGRSSVKSMALSLRDDGLYDITVRTWPY